MPPKSAPSAHQHAIVLVWSLELVLSVSGSTTSLHFGLSLRCTAGVTHRGMATHQRHHTSTRPRGISLVSVLHPRCSLTQPEREAPPCCKRRDTGAFARRFAFAAEPVVPRPGRVSFAATAYPSRGCLWPKYENAWGLVLTCRLRSPVGPRWKLPLHSSAPALIVQVACNIWYSCAPSDASCQRTSSPRLPSEFNVSGQMSTHRSRSSCGAMSASHTLIHALHTFPRRTLPVVESLPYSTSYAPRATREKASGFRGLRTTLAQMVSHPPLANFASSGVGGVQAYDPPS
ncbi:hypothetical protein FB451DRAFT_1406864 [Mycena latifolia]|nr:hypothetical protein FB451DRAFT_1406864 [Mycena latifolia]